MRTFGYFGGKTWHLKNILPLLPHTQCYAELFAGSAAVFFAKPLSRKNIINDRDDLIVNLFRVIRDFPNEFAYKLNNTPLSKTEFLNANLKSKDPIELARQTLILIKLHRKHALGPDIRESSFSLDYRSRVNRHFGKNAKMILNMTTMMQNAIIENRNAVELLRRINSKPSHTGYLIYADPPYLHSTRKHISMYRHEMDEAEHVELLNELVKSHHFVAISGYENEVYDDLLKSFYKSTWKKSAPSTDTHEYRLEVLWTNYIPPTNPLI